MVLKEPNIVQLNLSRLICKADHGYPNDRAQKQLHAVATSFMAAPQKKLKFWFQHVSACVSAHPPQILNMNIYSRIQTAQKNTLKPPNSNRIGAASTLQLRLAKFQCSRVPPDQFSQKRSFLITIWSFNSLPWKITICNR